MFLVALAVRLVVASLAWDLPIVRTPKLDSAEYLSWARRLAAGDFTWPIVSQHGPGYPFFLAALLALGSESLHLVLAVQAVLGALTAVMVAAVARECGGARAGVLAGLAYAIYAPAVYIETALVGEGLLVFLLMLAVFILSRPGTVPLAGGSRARPWRGAAAGVLLGVAMLVRPTAVLIGAACAIWLLVRRARGTAAALVVGSVVAIAPALVQTWTVSRSIGIQGYGGLNFYIGNSPVHTGRPTFRLGAGWDELNSEASRSGIAGPAAQDRYYVAKAVAEIRARPVAFLALLAKKCLWLVQTEEVRDSHSFYFFTDRVWALRILPSMAALFPLACVGALSFGRRSRPRRGSEERPATLAPALTLLLFYAAGASATIVLLVVGTRYRMPLVPVIAVAAGAGLDELIGAMTARRTGDLIGYAAAAVVAIAVSHALTDPHDRNLAEEWAFTGQSLITEHNLADADAAFRRGLTLDPDSGFAWAGLGLARYDAGRFAEARQALSRALKLDPANARATFHLALVDEHEGRLDAAVAGYRRAFELSPYDLDVARHLGQALLAGNKPSEATPYLQIVVQQAPDDAEGHRMLATALGMAGRSAEARTEMRRVVELAPSSGEAWLDLCLLSLDLHDVDTAAGALQRARELGAAPQRLVFASEALARSRKP